MILDPAEYELHALGDNDVLLAGRYCRGPLKLYVFALAVVENPVEDDLDLPFRVADGPDSAAFTSTLEKVYDLAGDTDEPFATVRIGGYPHDYLMWMEPTAR